MIEFTSKGKKKSNILISVDNEITTINLLLDTRK